MGKEEHSCADIEAVVVPGMSSARASAPKDPAETTAHTVRTDARTLALDVWETAETL